MISAIQQHESAIGIHMSPSSWTSLPPPIPSHPSRLSQSTDLSSESYGKFPLVIYLHMVMYMFLWYSLKLSHPLLSPPCPQVCSLCLVSTAALQIGSWDSIAAAAAKSLQSCPTLCDPTDGSPPGSPIPGILQARTLEWVTISFSNVWKWKVKVKSLSHVRLFETSWTAAYQASLSMGFSRQEYWSGLPFPSPIYALIYNICFCLSYFTLYNRL